MDKFLWIIRLMRQIEALFLPLFPAAWRKNPPSYRLIMPLVRRLQRYRQRYPWATALLHTVETRIYPPYHRWGMPSEGLAGAEMVWMRLVMALAARRETDGQAGRAEGS